MLVVWQDKDDGEEDADEHKGDSNEEYDQGQAEAYDAAVDSSTTKQDAEQEEVARAPVRSFA